VWGLSGREAQRAVLITGGAKRIGAAFVRALAADGWTVLLHYHASEKEAETLAQELTAAGRTCFPVQANLARPAEVDALIPRCLEKVPQLDCLVNSAAALLRRGHKVRE
jgi:hypothetical protein